jgi:hypothetical protein
VFRADIRSADLRRLGEYLVDSIEAELRAEQLPIDTFSALAWQRAAREDLEQPISRMCAGDR